MESRKDTNEFVTLEELIRSLGGVLHVHAELTPDEFVEKVARIIALEQMLTEQSRNPTIANTRVVNIFGITATMIEIGPDPELVDEFDDLGHMLSAHSAEARATAPVNENVAKALADFTIFRTAFQQREAVARNNTEILRMLNESMNSNNPDTSVQNDNNSPDSPSSPRMN